MHDKYLEGLLGCDEFEERFKEALNDASREAKLAVLWGEKEGA
jgi:hypothetical protein